MKNGAKIHLSAQEMELVTNKEWLFLKRAILEKIDVLLGGIHKKFSEVIGIENIDFINRLKNQGGKISRGENYKGLPYRILDYPASFSREQIFAVRTLFWWGNFFSISLHLSGSYLSPEQNIKKSFSYLKDKQFYIHLGSDQWDHDLDESGYIPISEISFDQFIEISKNDFFKISKKINLNEMDKAQELLETGFHEILDFVKISFHPGGEKVL